MKRLEKLLSVTLICGALACSMPAKAATTVYFRDSDRVILKEYVTRPATTTSTVTYYEPGAILPSTVTYTELPATVTAKLVAPPPGASYVMIDGNAYLVDTQKRVIIDAERLYE
jgi:hypothetical protein